MFERSIADRVLSVLRYSGHPLHYEALASVLDDVPPLRVLQACAALTRRGELVRVEQDVYALPTLPVRVLRAIAAETEGEISLAALAPILDRDVKYTAALCCRMVKHGRLVRRAEGVYAIRPPSQP